MLDPVVADKLLSVRARRLAMLALQSERYSQDFEYRCEVDTVLDLTAPALPPSSLVTRLQDATEAVNRPQWKAEDGEPGYACLRKRAAQLAQVAAEAVQVLRHNWETQKVILRSLTSRCQHTDGCAVFADGKRKWRFWMGRDTDNKCDCGLADAVAFIASDWTGGA